MARQLEEEGFVVLDAFAGLAEAHQVRSSALAALEQSATRGGLSGGGAASMLRGDRTLWATNQSEAFDALMPHLRRLDALVSLLGARLPDALTWPFVHPAEPSPAWHALRAPRGTRTGEGRLCRRRLGAVPPQPGGAGSGESASAPREVTSIAPGRARLDRLLFGQRATPHEVFLGRATQSPSVLRRASCAAYRVKTQARR